MAVVRSSAKRPSAAESGLRKPFTAVNSRAKGPGRGGEEPKFPKGMLPIVQVPQAEDRRKMVEDVARNLFPGKKSIGELTPAERARWIPLACTLLHGDSDAAEQLKVASEAMSEAEINLATTRAEAEERKRSKEEARDEAAHNASLAHQEKVTAHQEKITEIAGKRWTLMERIGTLRLDQERRREKNGDQLEGLLIGMMRVSFTLALVLIVAGAVITQLNGDPSSLAGWAAMAGGSGGLGLFSAIALMLHRTRRARIGEDTLRGLLSLPIGAEAGLGEVPDEGSSQL